MSRRLYAHMVVRDEVERYLQAALSALCPHVDSVHVHDDGSVDDSAAMAADMGATVTRRAPTVPAFLDDERQCRQHAWDTFCHALRPCPGDWVLAVDADELLVAPEALWTAVDAAGGAVSVVLPIPEVFRVFGSVPMVRVDGFWGTLDAPRLFAYADGAVFRRQRLACGSVPTYATDGAQSRENHGAQLLHLGYLEPEDRAAKHARYIGRPGHSSAHVGSILTAPQLAPWDGPPVDIWRGERWESR